MTPGEQTAWLAGLLDGEGCFGYYGTPRVSVTMTDEDVVARAATIMGGTYRARSGGATAKSHWKKQWICELNGDPAAEVMRRVRPLLGQRRAAAVDRALATHSAARVFTCPGCDETLPRLRRSRIHCSPRCAQRVYRRRKAEGATA